MFSPTEQRDSMESEWKVLFVYCFIDFFPETKIMTVHSINVYN